MSKGVSPKPGPRALLSPRVMLALAVAVVAVLAVIWSRANQAELEALNIEQGKQLAQMGRLQEAESKLLEVAHADPNNARCWETLATLYARAERYSQAIDALRHLIALEPQKAISYAKLAECQQISGANVDAVQQAREA